MKPAIVLALFLSLVTFNVSSGTRAAERFIKPDPTSGSSLAVVVEENAALAHTSQILPRNRATADIIQQTKDVLNSLRVVGESAGFDLSQTVKLNVYLSTEMSFREVRRILADEFKGDAKPAISFVVSDLAESGALVAIDAVAVSTNKSSSVKQIPADGIAVASILPAGPKLYVSGMADTNSLIPATRKTLEKLVACIGHFGVRREDIVQLKIFFQPMQEMAEVRKQVLEFFNGKVPPTVFVEWISGNPPVEIELIAAAKADSNATNTVDFFTPPGTTDSKVFRRVARVNHGKMIYVSGLYGMKATDGAGQVREIFSTLDDVVKQTGGDFEHLVKATYYVTDNEASNALNDLRPKYYHPQRAPAASKAKVKSVGLAGKTVMMDMIAVTK